MAWYYRRSIFEFDHCSIFRPNENESAISYSELNMENIFSPDYNMYVRFGSVLTKLMKSKI